MSARCDLLLGVPAALITLSCSDAPSSPLPDRAPNNCPNNTRKGGKDEQTLLYLRAHPCTLPDSRPLSSEADAPLWLLLSHIESTCGTDTRSTTSARASLLTYSPSEDLRSSRISCGPSAPSDLIVAARLHVYRSHPLISLCPGRRRGRCLALSALGGLGSLRQPCARQLCLLQFVSLVSVDRCAAQSFRRRNY